MMAYALMCETECTQMGAYMVMCNTDCIQMCACMVMCEICHLATSVYETSCLLHAHGLQGFGDALGRTLFPFLNQEYQLQAKRIYFLPKNQGANCDFYLLFILKIGCYGIHSKIICSLPPSLSALLMQPTKGGKQSTVSALSPTSTPKVKRQLHDNNSRE